MPVLITSLTTSRVIVPVYDGKNGFSIAYIRPGLGLHLHGSLTTAMA